MSLRTALMLALLGAPYAWLGVRWSSCLGGACQLDGHLLFYTLVALVALPFLLAIIGWSLAFGGARQVVTAGQARPAMPRAALAAMRGGVRFWIGLSLLLAALPACIALVTIIADTPEQGRDRLGRICETEGSRTTCRPDPAADRPSELDRINAARKRERWFAAD